MRYVLIVEIAGHFLEKDEVKRLLPAAREDLMAELLSLMWNRSMEKTSAALKGLALLGPDNEASHPLLPYIVRSCISLYSTLRFIRVLQLQICLHHFMLSLQMIFHLMSQFIYESPFSRIFVIFFYFDVTC